jgi:hypothetical protein
MSCISDFQSWLEANDVQYDLRLELVEDNMGIKVVAREDILDVGTAGRLSPQRSETNY